MCVRVISGEMRVGFDCVIDCVVQILNGRRLIGQIKPV